MNNPKKIRRATTTRFRALKEISPPVRWRARVQLQVVISYLKRRLYGEEHGAHLLTALVQGWAGGQQREYNYKGGR